MDEKQTQLNSLFRFDSIEDYESNKNKLPSDKTTICYIGDTNTIKVNKVHKDYIAPKYLGIIKDSGVTINSISASDILGNSLPIETPGHQYLSTPIGTGLDGTFGRLVYAYPYQWELKEINNELDWNLITEFLRTTININNIDYTVYLQKSPCNYNQVILKFL